MSGWCAECGLPERACHCVEFTPDEDTREQIEAAKHRCPHQGRYGSRHHYVGSDGRCAVCDGEDLARQARMEERFPWGYP